MEKIIEELAKNVWTCDKADVEDTMLNIEMKHRSFSIGESLSRFFGRDGG